MNLSPWQAKMVNLHPGEFILGYFSDEMGNLAVLVEEDQRQAGAYVVRLYTDHCPTGTVQAVGNDYMDLMSFAQSDLVPGVDWEVYDTPR